MTNSVIELYSCEESMRNCGTTEKCANLISFREIVTIGADQKMHAKRDIKAAVHWDEIIFYKIKTYF